MSLTHLTVFYKFGAFLCVVPIVISDKRKCLLQIFALVYGYLVLFLFLFCSVESLLTQQFFTPLLTERVVQYLRWGCSCCFTLSNIVNCLRKRQRWMAFLRKYLYIENLLNGSTKQDWYSAVFFLSMTACFVFTVYITKTWKLWISYRDFLFGIVGLIIYYYNLLTQLMIIVVNRCIKQKYEMVNYELTFLVDSKWLYKEDLVLNLHRIGRIFWMLHECVEDFTDIYGWQIIFMNGHAILSILKVFQFYLLNINNHNNFGSTSDSFLVVSENSFSSSEP